MGRLRGYGPGTYECRCLTCGETFEGAKRAFNCLPCARAIARGHQPEIPFASPEEAEAWEASFLEAALTPNPGAPHDR